MDYNRRQSNEKSKSIYHKNERQADKETLPSS